MLFRSIKYYTYSVVRSFSTTLVKFFQEISKNVWELSGTRKVFSKAYVFQRTQRRIFKAVSFYLSIDGSLV